MKSTPNKKKGADAMAVLKGTAKTVTPELLDAIATYIQKHRNTLEHCAFCCMPINDVTITYTKETAPDAIRTMVEFAQRVGKHEFSISDIKPMLTKTQYANLNHLVYLKGVIYRPLDPETKEPVHSKYYGINIPLALKFLNNETKFPHKVVTNRLTGEVLQSEEVFASEFPETKTKLDKKGNYKV